jgi:prepilin-type N-terminal cleavage/methylation domain-containing protein
MKAYPGLHLSARNRSGFTLIELLVVITIVAVLAAIMFPVYQSFTLNGKMVREVQAGRNLITGYLAAAADRDGQLLGGYDRSVTEVGLPDGTSFGSPVSNRYPYRVLPYVGNKVEGTFLINDSVKTIAPSNTYMVSCYPAFGINYIFVGGDIMSNGSVNNQAECISRLGAGEVSPLVFASAAGTGGDGKIPGYCLLTPPHTTGAMWTTAKWTRKSYAEEYGNVDPRYNGKAVCVFLDGSVQQLGIEDLRDMRLWSRNAALANNRNYTIAPSVPSNGR